MKIVSELRDITNRGERDKTLQSQWPEHFLTSVKEHENFSL